MDSPEGGPRYLVSMHSLGPVDPSASTGGVAAGGWVSLGCRKAPDPCVLASTPVPLLPFPAELF